jgi:hypothetical protein
VSALRCWASFSQEVLRSGGHDLPPSVKGLVAWSAIFRTPKVFGNYVAGVRMGCELGGLPTDATTAPELRRAKAAIRNRMAPPVEKQFIRRELVVRLATLARQERDPLSAMLYIISYSFLLRVPSEGLPLCLACNGNIEKHLPLGTHSALGMWEGRMVLRLATRKNRPFGSLLRRDCWCSVCSVTCPVHAIQQWIETFEEGAAPFANITAAAARAELRRRLAVLHIGNPSSYKLHDFRRGHAQDLLEAKAPLYIILQAGEWRSAAFLQYLDSSEVEAGAVLQSHLVASSDEEE